MNNLIGQVSYPVFLYLVWLFFVMASVFAFVVGIILLVHRPTLQRISAFMNRWFSVRKWMKPFSVPHYIEPVLLTRPVRMGFLIAAGAAVSVAVLMGVDAGVFSPLYVGTFPETTVALLAAYTRDFLLAGNALAALVGVLMMLAPRQLSRMIACTDRWCSVRQCTRSLGQPHHEVDQWVLKHSRVSGLALIVMSLGLMAAALPHI